MSNVFISYRRSDSEGEAGRLADDLSRRFGENAVFMDVDTIRPGRDFRKAIDESIRSCNALLAMVGPDWFGAADAHGNQRLSDESDYVRVEIASALKRDIPVIPVLVRGARMPSADTLPKDLEDLAYRNAVELTHARWRSDVQFLMDALIPLLDCAPQPAPVPSPVSGPTSGPVSSPISSPVPSHPPQADAPHVPSPIYPAALQSLGQELARYIGPIAPLLVKRAARGCTDLDALIELTAKEIDSPRDRAAFLALRGTSQKPSAR